MAKSLAELKKQSQQVLNKIKENQEESYSDKNENIWTPSYDKAKGVGYAKVRFMPAPQGEDFPFVTVYSYGFKGPTGKWYIENALSTLKKKDPCGEMCTRLWNSGIESDKEVARKYKRRTNIYANVLIIDDPMNPDNNGTVKLYRYGPMIQKILDEKMFPQFETDTPLNPFDPWSGATFEIRITTKQVGKDTVPNYEKSFFHEPSAMGDDEMIEEKWALCHSLEAMRAADKFKSYDELKNKLYEVLGASVGSGIATVEGFSEAPAEKPAQQQQRSVQSAPKQQESVAASNESSSDDNPFVDSSSDEPSSSGDSDIDFFNNL